jgi:hypothetical protein
MIALYWIDHIVSEMIGIIDHDCHNYCYAFNESGKEKDIIWTAE